MAPIYFDDNLHRGRGRVNYFGYLLTSVCYFLHRLKSADSASGDFHFGNKLDTYILGTLYEGTGPASFRRLRRAQLLLT